MAFVILALLVAVPLVEVFLFAEVGEAIGGWPTVGLVVLTAAVGMMMVRMQGMAVLARAQRALEREEPPVAEMAEGLGLLAAGVLLLVPGFFTDVIGFVLLVPPARMAILSAVWAGLQRRGRFTVHTPPRRDSTVVDAEYTDVTPEDAPPDEPRRLPEDDADTETKEPRR